MSTDTERSASGPGAFVESRSETGVATDDFDRTRVGLEEVTVEDAGGRLAYSKSEATGLDPMLKSTDGAVSTGRERN